MVTGIMKLPNRIKQGFQRQTHPGTPPGTVVPHPDAPKDRSKFDRLFLEEGLAELNSSHRIDRGPAKTCTPHAVSCTIGVGITAGIDARFPDYVIRNGELSSITRAQTYLVQYFKSCCLRLLLHATAFVVLGTAVGRAQQTLSPAGTNELTGLSSSSPVVDWSLESDVELVNHCLTNRFSSCSSNPMFPSDPTFPTVRVTGFFQADAGWFHQDAANRLAVGDIQDGADFRRARLAAVGKVADNVGYNVEFDFGFPGRPSFATMAVMVWQRG